ncbi:hypothetical protein GCM10027275_29910 [Rhabdobacter roseus]|uniref:TonB family protein n=1 Tax=Rhabdobacter roseus TaxID=1655419 RepID=A0A840TL74_9BACT|nr:M56 family metallopeptidase [Rhabdobacter roseus]MBB5284946.1 TonB family protein [Rhabdobacter roseus]
MELLTYIGKVSLYWVLLYACYWLLLRQHTFFRWNRAYLLGALLLAFVLPLVVYPASAPPLPVVYEVTATTVVVSAQVPTAPFPWLKLLALLYAAGVGVMLVKLAGYLRQLVVFIRQGETIELDECTLVLMDSDRVGSFSFLKWVVVSRTDYEQHFDAILRHELVHVQQRHSFDILLVEVLRVLFWFNPVLIFYKNSLQQVHEYLADEEAPERDRYAEFLVSYALGTPVAVLTNHFFNASLLKERIKMLYKARNSRWSLGKYGAVALLIGLVAIVAAGCEREGLISTQNQRPTQEVPAGQAVPIEGIVTGPNGAPLPGASIVLKDGQSGTTTDAAGRFQFNAPAGGELEISFVGHKPVSLQVLAKKAMRYEVTLSDGKAGSVDVKPSTHTISSLNADTVRVIVQPAATADGKPIFGVVEKQPEFPGGTTEMYKYLSNNIKYPDAAARASVEGKVFVNFVVTDQGEIKDIKILKGRGFGLDEEAVRVVSTMPRWKPGSEGGQPVNVRFNLPIGFSLNPDSPINQPANQEAKLDIWNSNSPNQPLFIIDGVKQEKNVNLQDKVQPNDIKSINVLKNKSATDIYGEQGKNGVILITTKKN